MYCLRISLLSLACVCLLGHSSLAKDAYKLWLQYDKITSPKLLSEYQRQFNDITVMGSSPTMAAIQYELGLGLHSMLGQKPNFHPTIPPTKGHQGLIIGTWDQVRSIVAIEPHKVGQLETEGYLISSVKLEKGTATLLTAQTETGLLYGTFHLLKLLQTEQDISSISVYSAPKTQFRLLNHWDNLDRTVERGYAGFSIWNWHLLPDHIDQQYIDYARANASIGINGTVLTNVNANALVLTPEYLEKAAALANTFRPYGIKVYLTARFSAPIEIGGLPTADPLDPQVQQWWKEKADEIYSHIPDFGGFLVKADSEGQPGPHNYGRTQAEGANLLADALAPHKGIVMWRAFVYSETTPDDRAKQAYNEFMPLDGKFRENVIVQVKNGPIDFQPREPFHPLFGAMKQTPLMMEFQITQEYLGHTTHLAYLAPMYREVLEADTYQKGENSTVAQVIDGSLYEHQLSAVAGVSNIGTDRNWTGHLFGQANWYALGRLAWDPYLSSDEIAGEWLKMTFSRDPGFVHPVKEMMLRSHEMVVNYMTPLGLHHIMAWSHHYGPGPWITDKHRDDWTSTYYHQASSTGIGFDRTAHGSHALGQYASELQKAWGDPKSIPSKYLLWFHHVSWDFEMPSGKTLWDELALHYQKGVDEARNNIQIWKDMEEYIDPVRFRHVLSFLKIQAKEAEWWKDACLSYFNQYAQKPFPDGVEKPAYDLSYYMSIDPKFVPGI